MEKYTLNSANSVFSLAIDAAGAPVTGLLLGDFTGIVSKNGGATAGIAITSVTELDAINIPGLYAVSVPLAVFDTVGRILFAFLMTGAERYISTGEVISIDNETVGNLLSTIDSTTSGTDSTVSNIESTVNDVNLNVDGLVVSAATADSFLRDIRAAAAQAGYRIVSPIYDGDNNLLSCTMEGFEPGDDPDVDVPRVTLSLTATYNVSGQLTSYKVAE